MIVDEIWPGYRAIVQCDHGKTWFEGDDFERFGGSACEECVLKGERIIIRVGDQDDES